jgi:hypothetical protein
MQRWIKRQSCDPPEVHSLRFPSPSNLATCLFSTISSNASLRVYSVQKTQSSVCPLIIHSHYSGVLTSSPLQGFCTRIVRSSLLPSHSSLIPRAGRHDTPEEKLHDDIRAQINASHRFQSFAGQRDNNFVKWCVTLYSQTAFSHAQRSFCCQGT